MKKRLMSMLLVMLCMFTAAMPVYADDASLYVYGTNRIADSGLLEGSSVRYLGINAYHPTDELYWTLKDQNDNLLYEGWLDPSLSHNSSFLYDPPYSVPSGVNLSFGPSVTHIKLTIECVGSPACDADAYIDTW